MSLEDYHRCANCGWEVIETNELGFCQTCDKAYQLGKESK